MFTILAVNHLLPLNGNRMKKLVLSALILLFCNLVIAQEVSQNKELEKVSIEGNEYYVHIVEKGNTLYAISRKYAISIEDLKAENPRLTKELTIGDRLLIPVKSVKRKDLEQSPDIDGNYLLHEVQKKNTLYSIAKEYHVEIDDIVQENAEVAQGLKKGMIIRIPVAKIKSEPNSEEYVEPALVSPYITHLVQPKETLYSLSKLYEVEIDSIKKVNNNLPGGLRVNQLINIPILKTYTDTTEPILQYDSSAMKAIYNVSLLLPLYANEIELAEDTSYNRSKELYQRLFKKAQYGIDFYQGFLLAADTMKKQGMNINLAVYDTENDTSKVSQLLGKEELKSSDLIVGPLFLESFMLAADFAKQNQLNIVSPVKQSNKILLGNPYVSKVATSSSLVMRFIGEYLADSAYNKNQNFLLIYPDHIQERSDAELVLKSYRNRLKSRQNDSIAASAIKEIVWKEDNQANIKLFLDPDTSKLNILVVPSEDQAFVTDLLTKLNSLKQHHFRVIGLSDWDTYKNIEVAYLHKMQVHLVSTDFVDIKNKQWIDFEKKYYKKFGSLPSKFSTLGFEVGSYYLGLMNEYGLNFQLMFLGYQDEILGRKFEFFKTGIESGYENYSIFVYKYRNYLKERVY